MTTDLPRIAILLATYNGHEFIAQQVDSILAQREVDVHVFASDDGSTDDTRAILESYAGPKLTLLPAVRLGGAGQNFLHLIQTAPWDDFDYVGFADQDDIWHPDKLARAVINLGLAQADAYSSNITAFWPDGRRQLIDKAQPQRRLDHLFEAAGPGHTYVLTRAGADLVRQRLRTADPAAVAAVALHDWLVYAILRTAGRRWIIDPNPSVDYRQHGRNVVGSGNGWARIKQRLSKLMDGWFRDQVNLIAQISGHNGAELDFIRRPRIGALPSVLRHWRDYRRKTSEAVVLAVAFIAMALRG